MTYAYNMDCMEAMRTFPDKFFDLAVVDPPYGIGITAAHKVGNHAQIVGGAAEHSAVTMKAPSKSALTSLRFIGRSTIAPRRTRSILGRCSECRNTA